MEFLKKVSLNNWFIILFSSFFFFFSCVNFLNLEPHHDQAFHIKWFQNLKSSNHFLPENFFFEFKNLLSEENGFIHELFRPSNNPIDYHAYLFQINSVLIVYFFSFFLNLDSIQLYNFVSIFFASLSIIINYQILKNILLSLKLYQNDLVNNFFYQLIFSIINISFYKYYFSPLGHHNIAYFFFSLTILIYLNFFNKDTIYPNIKLGLLTAFSVYFQITIGLLLIPFFSLLIIFNNFKISKDNFFNFIKYLLVLSICLSPFLFLITNNFLNSSGDFFNVLIGNDISENKFYLEKIYFWVEKLFILSGPINFFSFIISIIIFIKIKKYHKLYLIIFIHFLINLILSIFLISYLRNFYYIYNLVLIFSSFCFIYFFCQNNKYFKYSVSFILILNLFINLTIISNPQKIKNQDDLFYKIYYENQGNLIKKINKIKNLSENSKIIFLSDLSQNYFSAFDKKFVDEKKLLNRPLLNLVNLSNKKKDYSKKIIDKNKKINENFMLISISEKFERPKSIFNNFKKTELIKDKCKLVTPNIVNELIFRDSTSGDYNVRLFLTKVVCVP